MDELDQHSWWTPTPDDPAWALPDDLCATDPLGGRDCGWVNQMRPFVRHFSAPGEQVFDPFCGFGSTLLAAALEGRNAHGMEIDPARAQLARTRLQRHAVRAPVVVGTVVDAAPAAAIDLCLTNVPYFGCHWRGEAVPGQLYANADYAGYLSGMRAVLHALRKRLRPDAFGVAMVENVVVGGRVIPQAWDLGRILASLFTLREERVLCYQLPGAALTHAGTQSNRSHEYALIFQHCRQRLDLQQAAQLLQAVRAQGLPVVVHGSYARWLESPDLVPQGPADLDLILQGEQPVWDRFTGWLQAQGFALSLWGEPCRAPVALAAVRAHHYLRAERIGADGSRLQLDLQLPADEPPLP
ncbi:DNA methyltransferase [Xanthomonas hortorum]|uniref:DNA methyltransferase n=1 Tax=Xanthomonas hortorum TaxID=56454 RepID=UPI0032E8F1A6